MHCTHISVDNFQQVQLSWAALPHRRDVASHPTSTCPHCAWRSTATNWTTWRTCRRRYAALFRRWPQPHRTPHCWQACQECCCIRLRCTRSVWAVLRRRRGVERLRRRWKRRRARVWRNWGWRRSSTQRHSGWLKPTWSCHDGTVLCKCKTTVLYRSTTCVHVRTCIITVQSIKYFHLKNVWCYYINDLLFFKIIFKYCTFFTCTVFRLMMRCSLCKVKCLINNTREMNGLDAIIWQNFALKTSKKTAVLRANASEGPNKTGDNSSFGWARRTLMWKSRELMLRRALTLCRLRLLSRNDARLWYFSHAAFSLRLLSKCIIV